MAPSFVRGAHTKGNEVLAVLTITSPAAGNTLIAFLTKTTEPTVAPTFSDNTGGTWTVNATKALSAASANGTWMGTKVATGGETEIKGTGGTVGTLAYEEVSGLGALETITNADNIASGKEGTITFTGGKAGSYYIVCNGSGASCGTVEAWGGTGPTLTNAETALAAKNYTGHAVLTEPISAKTAISKHSAASTMGMLAVAFAEVSSSGYIAPITPPTFRTPRGLYKQFPTAAAEQEATVILKAAMEMRLTQQEAIAALEKLGITLTDQLQLKNVVSAAQKINVTMSPRFILDDKFAGLQKLAAALQTKLVLAESTVVLQTTRAAFTSKVVLKEEISGTVSIKFITGFNVGLTLADKATAAQLLKASPTAKLVIGQELTPAQAAKVAMTSQLNLKNTIKAAFKEAGAVRRVSIFIFEE